MLLLLLAAASPDADAAWLRETIAAGARACAAGRPAETMATVDPELVLSYPNTPDQGRDALAAGYARLCRTSGESTMAHTTPSFEEVSVRGDTAIVRVTWATHLRGMPPGALRHLRDLQVWRRTPAGWRFWRGVHYPERRDPPAAAPEAPRP